MRAEIGGAGMTPWAHEENRLLAQMLAKEGTHYRHSVRKPYDHTTYMRAYHQRPEIRENWLAYMRAYNQRPDVKAKKRAYDKARRKRERRANV